jgi:hypothetical protein
LFVADDKSAMFKVWFNNEWASCSVFSSVNGESKCVTQIFNESHKAMFVKNKSFVKAEIFIIKYLIGHVIVASLNGIRKIWHCRFYKWTFI